MANTETQMLSAKALSSPRKRSPIRIGNISTKPCSTGITIVGQRRFIDLRRSDHSSLAVNTA